MMRISFSPRGFDPAAGIPVLAISKAGDVLTVNDQVYDFSGLPDGATLPADAISGDWIFGPVSRVGSVLHVTLVLPHGDHPSPAVAYPQPVMVAADGPIPVPHDPEPVEPSPPDPEPNPDPEEE